MTGRILTLALAGCMLVACSASETPAAPETRASPTARESVPAAPAPAPLPTVPSTSSVPALAGELNRAEATLRDEAAPAGDVRRAGEFQQLAARLLATSSESFRRQVSRHLDPLSARATRSNVTASGLLSSLTEPQMSLPRWRIVPPRPAAELLGYYREAARRTGVPWTYLAAIHLVETRMGRIRGVSTAGALGPMQFLPSTWEAYGEGGDINDARDSIHAAARLLRANGAPQNLAGAIWNYNHSDSYVRAVTEYAQSMQRSMSAYRGYWHWRVLYRHENGTFLLPIGYPRESAVLLLR